jgi:pimeloyl-ACP methyl ester carboxylesterase
MRQTSPGRRPDRGIRPIGRRRAGPLAALLALALLSPAPAAAKVPLRRCDLGAGKLLRCGSIEVPLRRSVPSLGSTRIGFAVRIRGERDRPSLGTLLAADGGPGYASTAAPYVRSVAAMLGPFLKRHDVVFVDERGTGTSEAIDCRPLQRGVVQEYVAIGLCARQLGDRAAAYTTAEAAADLDAVRRALGRGRVYYYGDSYGTLLGQAYAVRFPTKLRALVLDSAYPANDPYYRTLYPAALDGLRVSCRHSGACSGDPVARFARVVRRFHAGDRSTEGLLAFLLGAGTLAPRSYLSLDDADRRFLRGEPRRLNRLIRPTEAGHGDLREFSYGMEIAVECNDYPLLWDRNGTTAQRIGQLSASVRDLPSAYFAPFSRHEYLFSRAAHLTNCLVWPPPPPGGLEPPVPAGWTAPRSFPTLVRAGEDHDVTSVVEARQVSGRFPRSRLYVGPNLGHAASIYFPFRSPAVGVIRRFLAAH